MDFQFDNIIPNDFETYEFANQFDLGFSSTIKKIGEPERSDVRKFQLSDESEDRHLHHVSSKGWLLQTYNKFNPVVMYNHMGNRTVNPDAVIGRGKAYVVDKTLQGECLFNVQGEGVYENVIAKKTLYNIDNGFIYCCSVGIFPFEFNWGNEKDGEDPKKFYFKKQELTEWSICAVPANRNSKHIKGIIPFLEHVKKMEEFINDKNQKDLQAQIEKNNLDTGIHPDVDDQHITNIKTLLAISKARLRARA